jgi:hypothetical protein
MAELYVRAGQVPEAERQIDSVLAMPGLSLPDRAWVLTRAVKVLLGSDDVYHDDNPPVSMTRRALALHYLALLDAMPRTISSGPLFGVLLATMSTYSVLGVPDSAMQYGLRAFALAGQTREYAARFDIAASGDLGQLALVLTADPVHYQHTIDSLITVLRGYVMEPIPAVDAQVRDYVDYVHSGQRSFEATVANIRTLGQPAPPYIATHWFNQPTPATKSDAAPNARVLKQDDGVIRVLGFGFLACSHCQETMGDFEKFQHELPVGVQCMFFERAVGTWGADLVAPDVEAEHMRHYYLERRHYTYPIAVWAGPKEKNEEGGMVPKFPPTMEQYGFWGGPHIVVVDGHGILRYKGTWNVHTLLRVARQLAQERAQPPRGSARTASALAIPPVAPAGREP